MDVQVLETGQIMGTQRPPSLLNLSLNINWGGEEGNNKKKGKYWKDYKEEASILREKRDWKEE